MAPFSLLDTLASLLSSTSAHTYLDPAAIRKLYSIKACNYFGKTEPLNATRSLLDIYSTWKPDQLDLTPDQRAQAVVLKMHEQAFDSQTVLDLAIGISLPLKEALRTCLASPPSDWTSSLYRLIGRSDLAVQVGSDSERDLIKAKDKQVSFEKLVWCQY